MRFDSIDALRSWRVSEVYRGLIAEAEPLVEGGHLRNSSAVLPRSFTYRTARPK